MEFNSGFKGLMLAALDDEFFISTFSYTLKFIYLFIYLFMYEVCMYLCIYLFTLISSHVSCCIMRNHIGQ